MFEKIEKFFNAIRKSVIYFFDGSVPIWYKLLPLVAIAYVIYPADFLNDFIPFLGQVDDVTALILSFNYFIELAERNKRKKLNGPKGDN